MSQVLGFLCVHLKIICRHALRNERSKRQMLVFIAVSKARTNKFYIFPQYTYTVYPLFCLTLTTIVILLH